MSTLAVKKPTPEQIKAYAETLPAIYREILGAMQNADPLRRYGGGIDPRGFWQELVGSRSEYTRGEYNYAVEQLEKRGFLGYDDSVGFYFPTDACEELMAVLTGKRAKTVEVPDLPEPNW
jgi:hypothetical protein